MCIACTEFIKGTLNFKEFTSALRETTMDDSAHLREVDRALLGSGQDQDAARKKLKELADRKGG